MTQTSSTVDAVVDLCCCPDSGGKLEPIVREGETVAYLCRQSRLVYPVLDGIVLLLPESARNEQFERPLIERVAEQVTGDEELATAVHHTLALLETRRGLKSWEWEDEEFWDESYAQQHAQNIEINWNDRLWQREDLVTRMLAETSLAGKRIVEIGSGEGQNFRALLAPHCDESSLYVAVDISLAALKLNRARNPHRNALYLLATAGQLPFKSHSIDVITYFGILHHTPDKAATLRQNAEKLRPGAYVLVAEAVERPLLGDKLPRFLHRQKEASAHEERIPETSLWNELHSVCKLLIAQREHSVFYTVAFRLSGKQIRRHRWVYRLVNRTDRALVALLGWAIPYFRPGTIVALGRRKGRTGE